jgi:hypothetical protein
MPSEPRQTMTPARRRKSSQKDCSRRIPSAPSYLAVVAVDVEQVFKVSETAVLSHPL